MKKLRIFFSIFVLVLFVEVCLGRNLAGIASNTYNLSTILMRLMWATCVIVGIVLSAGAFSQYRIHRRNPKVVSLFTPIVYVILALIVFAIPFAHQLANSEEISQPVKRERSGMFQDDNYLDRNAR